MHASQVMRIGEHYIPAFDVWMAVLRSGGNEAVTNNKLWATIGRSVTNPPQCAFFRQPASSAWHPVSCSCIYYVPKSHLRDHTSCVPTDITLRPISGHQITPCPPCSCQLLKRCHILQLVKGNDVQGHDRPLPPGEVLLPEAPAAS